MTTPEGPSIECAVKFKVGLKGRKRLVPSEGVATPPIGRIPRVSKLMALSIRINGLIAAGEIEDWAEAARLAHITRARASQIAALSLLAPDIMEEVLCLPTVARGRDPITERDLRPVSLLPNWGMQRRHFREHLFTRCG